MIFNIPYAEFIVKHNRWKNGDDIVQHVFNTSSPAEREFLLTGMSLEEHECFFD